MNFELSGHPWASLSRAPIPKFASYRGTSDANFGIKGALAIYLF
jgi:hypothetical protein